MMRARETARQRPPVNAVLFSPDASVKARVAVANRCEDGKHLHDIACTQLVKCGFYVVCAMPAGY